MASLIFNDYLFYLWFFNYGPIEWRPWKLFVSKAVVICPLVFKQKKRCSNNPRDLLIALDFILTTWESYQAAVERHVAARGGGGHTEEGGYKSITLRTSRQLVWREFPRYLRIMFPVKLTVWKQLRWGNHNVPFDKISSCRTDKRYLWTGSNILVLTFVLNNTERSLSI